MIESISRKLQYEHILLSRLHQFLYQNRQYARWCVKEFLKDNDLRGYLDIHFIDVKQSLFNRKVKRVVITTNRPGMLIGRQGTTLEKLENQLSRWLNSKVDVTIKEFDPFN